MRLWGEANIKNGGISIFTDEEEYGKYVVDLDIDDALELAEDIISAVREIRHSEAWQA